MDYTRICFVIMPFGSKAVGARQVDFDAVYDAVFAPAIAVTPLPEGGHLEPRRTDKDFFAGSISEEMFRYLEYSRFALADISGLNANVFYELGARHRARESGTAIFRQLDAPIPFDINQIKAFPYEYAPADKVRASRELVTQVLTESLQQNRLDSPVQQVLRTQQGEQAQIEGLLREAEDAVRNQDPATAEARYAQALTIAPSNALVRLKRGLLLKTDGRWDEALGEFAAAVTYQPGYAEAWRERGIAENKLHWKANQTGPSGQESLARAVALNARDFDALASLGGVLKRERRFEEAHDAYRRASEVSRGHSYPLLNEITLRAHLDGRLALEGATRLRLQRAERPLRVQVDNTPPYNAPWSFFDLAQVRLFLGDRAEFLALIERGVQNCSHSWQPRTFHDALALLADRVPLDGMRDGLALLAQRTAELAQLETS